MGYIIPIDNAGRFLHTKPSTILALANARYSLHYSCIIFYESASMKVIARFVPNRAGIPIIAKRMRYTNAQANHDWFLVNRWLDRLDAAGIVDSDAVCWFVSVNPAREMERELQ